MGNGMMKKMKRFVFLTIILAVIAVASLNGCMGIQKSEPEIISKAMLEKIIDVSDLSTFEAVYNGIARVMNEKNEEKVDYYVCYDAKVKAGFDFKEIGIDVDEKKKVITIKLPEIKINDVNVDITSLEYIFENNKANTSTVSEEAYKKCIEDVTNESKNEKKIYEIAEQNARNIIKALINPFIEQSDDGYELQID